MKEKFKKILENGRWVFVAIFILELFLVIFITPTKYDDEFFLNKAAEGHLLSFAHERYFNWTSRILLELVLCFIFTISKYVWMLIQALAVTLIGYSISRIFIKDNKAKNNVMLLFMILAYPFNLMNSSGWATATSVYMWPLATCLFALIPISKIWNGEKIKKWQYPLYTLSLIFAADQEQTCAILVGTYILFSILMIIKNKKIHPFMIIQSIIIIACLTFIITCPGNYVRKAQELEENFPDMAMLNIFDKVGLGFTSTMGLILGDGNIIFTILTLLIMVYIFNLHKDNMLYKTIGMIPFCATILGVYTTSITSKIFPFITSFYKVIAKEEVLLTAANCSNLLNVMPIIFTLIIFSCVVISLLIIFKNLKNNIAILVFLIGFASRLIMGFSPTVFVSGGRTMIFFEFAMIIVCMLILQEFNKETDKSIVKVQNRTVSIIKIMSILQYLNILFCILLTQK